MAAVTSIKWEILVQDASGIKTDEAGEVRFAPGAGTYGKREDVSLTGSAFVALSPPSGAKALVLFPGTAPSLVLKSVTGDGGTNLTPASNALGIPLVMPLGATPNIGILNSGATVVVSLLWL